MNEKKNLKWGIVGLGGIAHKFAKDLKLVDNSELVAVASRNADNATSFAREYQVSKAYDSYLELFQDENVDIVYIATPHNSHAELSVKAMDNGKHVLCEKPLAVNQLQVQKMIDASLSNGVFLMEAFWSRFNPSIIEVLRLINDEEIGKVNYVNADFCFYGMDSNKDRVLSMDLAGGALLDIGVYPLFLAYVIFGVPDEVLASSVFHSGGADIQTSAILKYDQGIANIMSGFNSNSDMIAKIYGEKGSIYIDSQWHHAQGFSIIKNESSKKYSYPTKGTGFTYEIEECEKCISEGMMQSSNWTHQNSLELIKIADQIRQITGLKYPFED